MSVFCFSVFQLRATALFGYFLGPTGRATLEFDDDKGTLRTMDKRSRESLGIDPDTLSLDARYIGLKIRDQRYRLKVYCTVWYCPEVWWEARLLGSPLGVNVKLFYEALGKTHFQTWEGWIEAYMPTCMGMRRCYDRTSADSSYLRCFPEHALSTQGLLIILAHKWERGRPAHLREDVVPFLEAYLNFFFCGEDLELCLDFGPGFEERSRMNTVSSQALDLAPASVHIFRVDVAYTFFFLQNIYVYLLALLISRIKE